MFLNIEKGHMELLKSLNASQSDHHIEIEDLNDESFWNHEEYMGICSGKDRTSTMLNGNYRVPQTPTLLRTGRSRINQQPRHPVVQNLSRNPRHV